MQGPGTLREIGPVVAKLGEVPALIVDAQVAHLFDALLTDELLQPSIIWHFSGEVTDAAIEELASQCAACDVVIAAGGGKALDAGKAVALRHKVQVVSVPTIASNDGPASRGIAIYEESHRLVRVDQMPSNPAAVIVDSAVIARAPVRLLRAGVGDAIAKTFEANACWAGSGLTKHGTRPTHSGRAIAKAAYDLLRAHAHAGIAAAERQEVTEDLEATIEACVLLSAMGFENGGLSIAHSVTRGLMTLRGAKDRLHGEHVAYGALVQLAAEGRPNAEIQDLAAFLTGAGLPVSLGELGVLRPGPADMDAIAVATMTSPHMHALPRPIQATGIAAAIARIEALGSV
ncbi:glycerol dehydrogenase [Sphingobium xenophagum]|uniref:Glycerol dehydrogenase n=1 Tax=Sphingobium xenophagum TaxID=121428 RepID=A0ABU1X4C6_SPHXE|nr:glycerol dehydrogenase [Sphingobium xenophagum]MDR7156441.1 glycerol dehydrogenase [Sphingobium xenophagum]